VRGGGHDELDTVLRTCSTCTSLQIEDSRYRTVGLHHDSSTQSVHVPFSVPLGIILSCTGMYNLDGLGRIQQRTG